MNKTLLITLLISFSLSAVSESNKFKTFLVWASRKVQADGNGRKIQQETPLPNQKVHFLYRKVDEDWCDRDAPKLNRENFNKWVEGN